MNTHTSKTQEKKSKSASLANSQMKNGGESTFQFVDNRPEAIAQRKLQETANNSPLIKQLKSTVFTSDSRQYYTIQKKQNVVQLLSEKDEDNKRLFWQIYTYRPGKLKEAIEFLFETYNIGSLGDFDLVIDDGEERFHGMTEFGFNHKRQYRKPRMTISSKYVWRMYDDNFERILRTLRHEMRHVNDKNNPEYMSTKPTTAEMEFRAYYQELFDNSGAMPEHMSPNKFKRTKTALQHYEDIPKPKKNEYLTMAKQIHQLYKSIKSNQVKMQVESKIQ